MGLFKQVVLKNSIEIKASPERIWAFFANIEKNYKSWHPKEHILFHWTKGKPLETGSTIYSEEVMNGELLKIKATVVESVPNRKVEFKLSFPLSFMCPKLEWRIEPKGSNSVFTAITYYKFGRLFLKFGKKRVDKTLEIARKHIKEEGENLKKILEKKNN